MLLLLLLIIGDGGIDDVRLALDVPNRAAAAAES